MSWRLPPSRREITLLLFSLIVFILFYNLDISFRHLLGVDPASSETAVLGKLGLKKGIIDTDGRRPPGWRDSLEGDIFGEWGWEEGQVAGNGAERQKAKDGDKGDRYGAIWLGQSMTGAGENQEIFGVRKASDTFVHWGDKVPETKVVKHVPGYTILDSVIILNGTLWLVTNDKQKFPSLGSIASSSTNSNNPPQNSEWQIVSTEEAKKLGSFAAIIRDVSWIATDITHSNHTLFSLWRTYSSLDLSIDSEGQTTLPLPRRLFFPHVTYFTQRRPDPDNLAFPRLRSKTGVDGLAAKAAFPALSLMYRDDWDDFAKMQIPFLMERVVIADRGAAVRARTGHTDQPLFSPPFNGMEASKYWWEPIRRMMARFVQLEEDNQKSKFTTQRTVKHVVTYLSTQERKAGPKIRDEDHKLFVKVLKRLGSRSGFEVNIVPGNAGWLDRMKILTRSTVVVGVYGSNLADTYFMKPSPHTMLMEFFPTGYFSRNQELPARSIGIRYIAWWNERKLAGNSLPPTVEPHENSEEEIYINPAAIIQTIREEMERSV